MDLSDELIAGDTEFDYPSFAYNHNGESWVGLINEKVDQEAAAAGHQCGGLHERPDGTRVAMNQVPCPDPHPDPAGVRQHWLSRHMGKWLQQKHDYCEGVGGRRWAFGAELTRQRPGAEDPTESCSGCLFSFWGRCPVGLTGPENQQHVKKFKETIDSSELMAWQVAEVLEVSVQWVYRLVERGELRGRHHLDGYAISKESVAQYLALQKEQQQSGADQAGNIRQMLRAGHSIREVAKHFSVGVATVHRAKKEAA